MFDNMFKMNTIYGKIWKHQSYKNNLFVFCLLFLPLTDDDYSEYTNSGPEYYTCTICEQNVFIIIIII